MADTQTISADSPASAASAAPAPALRVAAGGLGAAVLGLGAYWLARAVMIALAPQSQWVAPLPVRSTALTERQLPALRTDFDAFHRAPVEAADTAPGADAPETTLNLVLRGQRASGARSSATIQTPDRAQRTYYIGDEILPGVSLQSVAPGYVVIDRSGQLERLSMREDGELFGMSDADRSAQVLTTSAPVTQTGKIGRIAQPARPVRGRSSPSDIVAGDLIQNVSLTPVRTDGRTEGFRIGVREGAGTDLSRFGLQGGDIITKINGTDLTKGRPDMSQLMGELSRRPDATLVLMRDGDLMTVRIGMQ